MISLEKTGNAIKFTFDNNGHYLQDGTIEVPVNSLTLVTDDSEMFTFKKSATNDIFVSGLYSEIGMTKAQLISFYKNNMVDSFINADEAQSMIDESISGKADYSAATTVVTEDVKVTGSTYGSISFDYEDSVYYTSGYCYHLFDSASINIVYSDGVSNYTVYINGNQSVDNENYTYSSTNNDFVFQTKGSNKIISFSVSGSEDPVYYAYKYFVNNDIAVSTAIENIINPKLESLDTSVSGKLDASAYTPVTIDSAITSNSTNAVQSSAIYDKVTISVEEIGTATGSSSDRMVSNEYNYSDGVFSYSADNFSIEEQGLYPWLQYNDGESTKILMFSAGTVDTDDYSYTLSGNSLYVEFKGANRILGMHFVVVNGQTMTYSYSYVGGQSIQWLKDYVSALEARVKILEQNNT